MDSHTLTKVCKSIEQLCNNSIKDMGTFVARLSNQIYFQWGAYAGGEGVWSNPQIKSNLKRVYFLCTKKETHPHPMMGFDPLTLTPPTTMVGHLSTFLTFCTILPILSQHLFYLVHPIPWCLCCHFNLTHVYLHPASSQMSHNTFYFFQHFPWSLLIFPLSFTLFILLL